MALLAAYSFDEGTTTVTDYSGNGRDWVLNNNAIKTATGHTNGGLTKSGALLPVVANPSFVGTGAWTMMFWRMGFGDSPWWCRLYNTAADTGSGILMLSGNLNVRIRTPGGSNVQASTVPPGDGLWHHYAATYDGSVGRLYVDAVLVATTGAAPAPTAAVNRIDIAEHTLNNAFTDDLRFHDEALNQATISTLKDTPVVASAGNVTGTGDAGLGSLVGTASGTRSTFGTAVAPLDALTATANGTRTAVGTAVADLGALASNATGVRSTFGTTVAALGTLAATATGASTPPNVAAAALGSLTATAVATRTAFGVAVANLGALVATAIVPNPVPIGRIRISGREPLTRVSGREPREEIP